MNEAMHLPAAPFHLPPVPSAPFASPELAGAVVDALADAVVVYDAAGRILGGNPAAVALLGLTQPSGQDAWAIPVAERAHAIELRTLAGQPLSAEDWPTVRALRGETLAGAATADVVVHTLAGRELILNVSGAPLHDEQGQVIGAVCVCRDITERVQLEREVATRAAELESIFATQAEAVVFADRTGRIVRMNAAQRQLLASRGVDPDAEYIQSWAQYTAPHDALGQPVPPERLPFYRALRGETVTGEQAVELYQRTQDGLDLVIRVSGAPVRDTQGRILGAVLTTFDVTPQRRLEQQRLAVMRVVAHDLANPVAAVRLYLQTQQRRVDQGYPPFTPGDPLFHQLDYGLTRMQRLLDDLRVATQVELGTLDLRCARQDVAALCREEAAAQQGVTGRTIDVQTPTVPVWAMVDRERLGQVIANLLTNALKYSPEDQPVTVSVQVADGRVRVAVRDTGPGIPAHEQRHLFEQFHRVAGIQAHDGAGSLGLGLYISKAIIVQHGGELGVESAVGVGSTFWFCLPLATPSADG